MNSNPLQKALEEAFPDLDIVVTDHGERIFVDATINNDRKTFSTPHTVNASLEPWQYWLARFTQQLVRRMS